MARTFAPQVCSATNPESKINLQLLPGATIIDPTSGYGTLDGVRAIQTGSGAMLHLKGGTDGAGSGTVWINTNASVLTVNVNLDTPVDNAYRG